MATAAPGIISRLEQQLHSSQRSLRLYFAIGGGLLGLGIHSVLSSGTWTPLLLTEQTGQVLGFFIASCLGYIAGGLLLKLAMPPAISHVESLLIDGLLLTQLLDSPQQDIPSRPEKRSLVRVSLSRDRHSMASRMDWIVNNWSIIIHRMGYRPLPPRVSRLHMLYLVLIIAVPLLAVLSHNVLILLILGSVYVFGLALDAIECDSVRTVLLAALRGDG